MVTSNPRHSHAAIEPVPRDPRDLDKGYHCKCGATICFDPIPLKNGQEYACILTKGHDGMCDNPRIPAAQLYWRRYERLF